MAPTAEQTLVTPTKAEPLFSARALNLRLVVAAVLRYVNQAGAQITQSPGFTLEFENGSLKVSADLQERYEMFRKRYMNLYDEPRLTRAENLADWIRSHPGFNSQGPEGFVELKPTIPDAAPVVMEIAESLMDGDQQRIGEIFADEIAEDGFKRQEVISAATRALERLEGDAPTGIETGPEPQEPEADDEEFERAAHEAARRGMSAPTPSNAAAFLRDVDAGLAGEPTHGVDPTPVDGSEVAQPEPGPLAEAVAEASDEAEPTEAATERQGDGYFGGPPGSE